LCSINKLLPGKKLGEIITELSSYPPIVSFA
jgi:hypothetical protein